MENRNNRKIKEGLVISKKMQKTAVVEVTYSIRHSKYKKVISRKRKYYAHDEQEAAKEGDRVKIRETRPLSKTKRWAVVGVLS